VDTDPTFGSYVEMWTLKPFGIYFWNSIVSLGHRLLSTVLGALAGYGFPDSSSGPTS
jgi:ABC-type glycerol-3-phosphate transport system permease component